MTFAIRPAHPSDLYALYRICLLTGASGEDASALVSDPELYGHNYVAPYAVLEPGLSFVLTRDGAPCGYVVGTADSAAFGERCEREWLPQLRARYPLPPPEDTSLDAQLIRQLHEPRGVHPDLAAFPAHLHINLLPAAQGMGWGRRLVETFLGRLRELGAAGVHLGVASQNWRAVAFYERLGFRRIRSYEAWIAYAMDLRPTPAPAAGSAELAEALALRAAGDHEAARRRLVELAAQRPHDAEVQYQAACVHDFLGLEREAVPFYLAAIRSGLAGADLRGAYLGLGSTYRTLGQYQEARDTLLEGLARFPEAAEMRVFLAMARYNLGEHHEAVATLLRVVADTTADDETRGYERAIRLYAEDLDRRWD